jgi:hypothetical protein
MTGPTITTKTGGAGPKVILDALQKLEKRQVYVGIPENKTARKNKKGQPINNAELAFILTHGVMRPEVRAGIKATKLPFQEALALYIHTFGSPSMQIPPRPILEPAIEAAGNKEKIEAELKLAAAAALDGDDRLCKQYLQRAGMMAQIVVKAWFVDPRNNWPPNAPSTIKRKGSDRPNIDTSQLRNAISWVLAE